ncbi:MAG: cyclic nucleotide-binding domain-containing protein [Anaerolineae bacterium]
MLFRQGDPGEAMLLITAGQVRIFLHDAQGNEITLRTVGRQIVGEFSLLDHKPRSASASALTVLDVLVLQRADFHDAAERAPAGQCRADAQPRRADSLFDQLSGTAVRRDGIIAQRYDARRSAMALASDEDENELITAFLTLVRRVRAVKPENGKK